MSEKRFYTEKEWLEIASNLQKQLGPEYLAQRPGPSGSKLTYIEGKTAINIANDIFGFNGWSSNIIDTTVDFVDVAADQSVSIGVSVTVRITLKDGSYHEDVGYGTHNNAKNKGQAFEKARKQAVTDATKRTLRFFGNALGNCLYDNPYLNGIGKMAKPTIKFTPQNLYRHTQFDAQKQQQAQVQPPQVQYHPPEQSKPKQPEPQRVQPPKQTYQPQVKQQPNQPQAKQQPTKPQQPAKSQQLAKPQQPAKSPTPSPQPKEEPLAVYNATLQEPIIPEDSFSYEGDEEFFAQVMAVSEDEFKGGDDGFEEELLAGIITPPPPATSSASSPSTAPGSLTGIRKEAPLSDLDERNTNTKRSCLKRI